MPKIHVSGVNFIIIYATFSIKLDLNNGNN